MADVRVAPTPNAIERDKQSRRIDVGANVGGAVTWPRSWTTSSERLAGVSFPLGYHAEVLGESTELERRAGPTADLRPGGRHGDLLLLQAAFGSFRLALLTFLLLPMALVGGAIAVRLSGGVLSLGSLVGFLAVFGIAARNGIMMVSHFQRLESEEGVPSARTWYTRARRSGWRRS